MILQVRVLIALPRLLPKVQEGYGYIGELSSIRLQSGSQMSQVFEGRSTFYDALQFSARQVAAAEYDLEPNWDCGFGQAAYESYVSEAAKNLVDTCGFIHYGIDDLVRDCLVIGVAPLMRNSRAKETTSTIQLW
jgi:hypothetical protein